MYLNLNNWSLHHPLLQQILRGHTKMILDMVLSKDCEYLYTASVDTDARSWLLDFNKEAKVFEGANRSVTTLLQKGYICKCLLLKESAESAERKKSWANPLKH